MLFVLPATAGDANILLEGMHGDSDPLSQARMHGVSGSDFGRLRRAALLLGPSRHGAGALDRIWSKIPTDYIIRLPRFAYFFSYSHITTLSFLHITRVFFYRLVICNFIPLLDDRMGGLL